MAEITLNGQPVLELDLHLPLNGAWSAELQVADDAELTSGDEVTLALPELELTGRVVRAGLAAERLRVRLTGGATDWGAAQEVKHYRNTTADQVLADVGATPDQPTGAQLAFWTRAPGTTGSTVAALAAHLGFNWRVNPDGTLRIREESPAAVDLTGAVEVGRDPARGLVELAPEAAVLEPGCAAGDDQVGDVLYSLGAATGGAFRVRYYTEARATLRGSLERLIRWVMRDTLFLGMYTAAVVRQAADGTLDLLPDDDRLRSQGLQAVPIRHGLPGVTVEVPAGERVLLGFDSGRPEAPYAALWHAGQATKIIFDSGTTIEAAGTKALALAVETKLALDTIQAAFDAHMHPTAGTGPPSPPVAPIGPLGEIATEKLLGA
jgi:hypothetical protein